MKSIVKKSLAITIIAMMLLISAIPFVSAATALDQSKKVSFTLNCDKDGYNFTVYEVAKLKSGTTPTFETAYEPLFPEIAAEVASGNSKNILNKLNSISPLQADMPAAAISVGTFDSKDETKTFSDLEQGIYFVKCTAFPAGVKSPEYNADGTVTFRCQAPDAQKVALECQMFSGTKDMEKDDRGVWSITVKPDVPDIYPYAFQIDGTQVADPNNMHMFPNENFKYSLVDVRGEAPSVQDIQEGVPHGKVSYRYYYSKACGIERPMCVYTPAGYDPKGTEKLPVLYLIHGMTDTYETWFKVGQMNNILDNMIAKGEAKRMIVVMPYANPYPEMIAQGKAQAYNSMDVQLTTKEFVEEVMPFIEKNYNVIADADHRAIAGFSLGGRQTLAAGFGNPDKFHYVAAYAPAIFGNEYETNFTNGTYKPMSDLKKQLKFMFLGTGKEDFLISASQGLDKYLTDQGLKHTFYNPGGGHTWMNCRDYLELTVKELFK